MYRTRSAWGARSVGTGPTLDRRKVVGIALHYPGDSIKRDTVEEVEAALRSWQRQHIDGNGWRDIAYQEAVDQAGNVYRLRGLSYQSAANGDEDVNERYGALLLVLAVGEKPSRKMVAAVRRRIGRHREKFPQSDQIVPHSLIRPEPTACPGDVVRALIRRGEFEPSKPRRLALARTATREDNDK